MSVMTSPWREEIALLAGIAAVAAGAGLASGLLLPWLLLGMSSYAGWHLYQLSRLPGLFDAHAHREPHPFGLWRSPIAAGRARLAAERRQVRELEEQTVRLRASVAALPDAVLILDRRDRVEWSNTAAQHLLGISAAEITDHAVPKLLGDPLVKEYMATGEFSQPLVINSPTDRARIVSLQANPLDQASGLQVLVARDITRQYHADRVKRDFVANISHELRTPLTVISGLAQQLDMHGRGDAGLQQATGLMLQQVQRMNEMITDLLTLSRLEMQPASARDEEVDVADMLATIAEEARALSGASGHAVRLELESHAALRGDGRELRTAFTNLTANAIRHTPPRSEVRIRWQADADGAVMSVSDSGPGIAARHIPRLTERLYRVDPSRSRDTGGSGLGLAIVKHILDRHQAKLEISSKVGGGSTFTCRFPARRVIREAGAG